MLVEIEGCGAHECILSGKRCEKKGLYPRMRTVLECCETEIFTRVCCHRCGFETYALDDEIAVDFALDPDIRHIFELSYGEGPDEILSDQRQH